MSAPFVSWTLSLNGGSRQTLANWSIENPRTSFRSMAEDHFSFNVSGDVRDDCPFEYGDTVILYRNDVVWFSGTVSDTSSHGTPKDSEWSVVCAGPWWQLSRTMYQQPMAGMVGDSCETSTGHTTKVVLFQAESTTAPVTTGQQVRNALNYAISVSAPVLVGSVPDFVSVFFETAQDLTVADVIRRSLQWTPDAVAWFDYSTVPPTFNCAQRSLLTPVSLDLDSASGARVESFNLSSRNDLVPTGVRFNYLGMKRCAEATPVAGCDTPAGGGGTHQVTTITADNAGSPDSPGGLIATVSLAQLTKDTTEPAPTGLAALYRASLSTVNYEGPVVTRERECSGTVRVRNILNISNGATAWASMNATVQEIEEQLNTGVTSIRVGTPSHLGAQDFVTLIQLTRRRALVVNSFPITRAPGTVDTPNCNAALDPDLGKLLNTFAGGAPGILQEAMNQQEASDVVTNNVVNNIHNGGQGNRDSVAGDVADAAGGNGGDNPVGNSITNTVVNNITNNPANAQKVATAVSKTPQFQTKSLDVCKEGTATNVKVFGPP